ncbi:stage III sporulation protein AA [Paenibacillus sp. MY03]|jgi:stage III sporulation protein AA|uniref:Stage III sporulation protein AA n=1 Tax=Paenibacillus agaridevorans TaxID=171404 RepID=A0A2R5F139_9BACL|nr:MULTISPECIES: stage III sporulation protein AA [Paenibacillus]OUS77468.1 stage III sporulation protein AA [Paenibacillus sp. MY03]GBG12135.1 stage III sporulation protein AA [Paenibacillus agaridevorans]
MLAQVSHLLPLELKRLLEGLPADIKGQLEEIRIRENRPLEIAYGGNSRFITADSGILQDAEGAVKPTAEQCRKLLERITNYSLYAMEEELRRGYITVSGGHRIGLAGRTILDGGIVRGIRDIGGFNIRIAREVIGASVHLLPKLLDRTRQSIGSTLILAPPQQGKTTLIRDLARAISYGAWTGMTGMKWRGRKVGIVDERSEIAACVRGIPTFDIGPRTDVMDACPKAEGIMMLLRSMSPEVLVVDEVGRPEDADAIREASHAGVAIIATAHAYDLQDAKGRPELNKLIQDGTFAQIVELKRTKEGVMHRVVRLGNSPNTPSVGSETGEQSMLSFVSRQRDEP